MVSRQLDCPVFKLTHADIRNGFEPFIERVESQIEEYGIAKLVPPINWTPRMAGYNDELDFTIPRPIRQNVTGGRGIFRTILVEEKPMSVKTDFRPMAMLPENNPKSAENIEDLEYQFWRNLRFQPPLYGADVEGSLFDEDLQAGQQPTVCVFLYIFSALPPPPWFVEMTVLSCLARAGTSATSTPSSAGRWRRKATPFPGS
mmetsp:Transcript_13231/g.37339  ORF Transcript_13231/g.37339 Transcript_13231/m.37339 type:complete len:202 (-) Transcript_13231:1368-1973(-)